MAASLNTPQQQLIRNRVWTIAADHRIHEPKKGRLQAKLFPDNVQLRNVDLGLKAKATTPIRTLIVDNYDSYTYNLFQLLSVVNGEAPVVIRNDELSFHELRRRLYHLKQFDNIVISPGPGSPLHPKDIGVCLQLVQECHDIPILGVCMGHQVLGFAHGMRVSHAPEPVHGRLSEIEHYDHPLFKGIPSGADFKVVRYHSLILDMNSIPRHLTPTAWTASEIPIAVGCSKSTIVHKPLEQWDFEIPDPRNHLLMGVSHTTLPHHGVQFHPESIATTYGRKMLENFCDITRSHWEKHPRECSDSTTKMNLSSLKPAMAEKHRFPLKLNFTKLEGMAKACGGTETLFTTLFGAEEAQNTFWLDSSIADKGRARFSYMGGSGGQLWKKITYSLEQGILRIENRGGDVEERKLHDGFFSFLDQEIQSYSCDKQGEVLPFDFIGGYVGYLGYELKAECGAASNRFKSPVPDAAFFMVDRFLAVDHHTDDAYIVALSREDASSIQDAASWIDETAKRVSETRGPKNDDFLRLTETNNVEFTSAKSKHQYMADVLRCQEYISDGESYEVCLTTQLTKAIEERDLLDLYKVLRRTNPAPYAAWLNFGKYGPSICCSSPERFLRLDQAGVLEAKPIKGTVRRGNSQQEDYLLRLQLEQSEKDKAENLMIVDLLRNDLGRVCVPGSVHVPKLMEVESYSTVHTMVSTVRGTKQDDATPIDCVKAAFPGGSMTGAPKLRTMEILDSIETSARGVYSGAIGFFSFNSSFDLNIVIRTMVIHGGMISLGAGGAVVSMSDPKGEYEEMLLKTRAAVKSVDIFSQMEKHHL